MRKYYIENDKVYVYMLYDNIDNIPIYVGATKDLKTRMRNHRSDLIKNYHNKNYVTIELIEETTFANVINRESFWICFFKTLCIDIFNSDRNSPYSPAVYQYVTKEYEDGDFLYIEKVSTYYWRELVYSDLEQKDSIWEECKRAFKDTFTIKKIPIDFKNKE